MAGSSGAQQRTSIRVALMPAAVSDSSAFSAAATILPIARMAMRPSPVASVCEVVPEPIAALPTERAVPFG